MSAELKVGYRTGSTLYAVVQNAAGQYWNTAGTPAFEAYTAGNFADYDVALVENGVSGTYIGTFPVGITTAGLYRVEVRLRAGGSPATSDPILCDEDAFEWSGTAAVGLSTAIPELAAAAPSATPNVFTGLALLYMALRNKRLVTATTDKIHNDAGTAIASSTISDDLSTFTHGEYGAP